MTPNDLDNFYTELAAAVEAVGRPKLSEKAASIFFNRLSGYQYDWVVWALNEAIDRCDSGWQLNPALIKSIIDAEQRVNKFRAEMTERIHKQIANRESYDQYLESDEFKKNQQKGRECISELKGIFKDDI